VDRNDDGCAVGVPETCVADWAEAVGIERKAFEREHADPKTREALVAAKREGLRRR